MNPTTRMTQTLEDLLHRSDELGECIFAILQPETYSPANPSSRFEAAIGLALISMEHATALRVLVGAGLMPSAFALMRPQFEALTRSVWMMWAAQESDVYRIQAILTLESEKDASKLAGVSKMLADILVHAPPGPAQMLAQFKEVSLASLNSYVHGGIHVLARQAEGYPLQLVDQVVRNSNGLQTMAGMLLAMYGSSADAGRAMSKIQWQFADCLPTLLPVAAP